MSLTPETITSRQNPKIKNLTLLQKHSERLEQDLFILEGIKEIEKAIKAGYYFDSLFFLSKLIDIKAITVLFKDKLPKQIYEVNADVYEKIAYRENSGGIVALARPQLHSIDSLKLTDNPLFLVIESVEKPGNLGAIYRTADAAGIDAIIICDPKTDLYNPNAVRASLGCVFTVPTVLTTSPKAISWLKNQNIKIFCTYLKASVPYHSIDYTNSSAIVMGSEATGISPIWVEAADANIIIPMSGAADSMNVSTSAAVLIFEACRQRGFKSFRK
jgi:RNA methyltransferase, TrmH family